MLVDRLADFRSVFAEVVLSRAGSSDPRLLRAFSEVPRHEFIGPGPWYFTERGGPALSKDPAVLYQDVGLGLIPERGIPTGLPSLHARCMAACELHGGEKVVHVGAGSGYFTAILAEVVGESGAVVAYEVDAILAERAARNLQRWGQVRLERSSAVTGISGSVDLIYVCAGVQQVPRSWVEALAPTGRLLFPLTPSTGEGGIFVARRTASKTVLQAEFICRARFFPCTDTEDEAASALLNATFAAGGHETVHSLRLHPEAPDETAWFSGRDWWLSTRPASE
jgi:protein-L-isoaspartate(D-aspartate) O-methyltransferase